MKLPVRLACLAGLALVLVSCAESVRITAPEPQPPKADSPLGVARRLEWAVDHSDLAMVDALLAADFGLISPVSDSAGGIMEGSTGRRDFLEGLRSMFDGVPGRYEPAIVSLEMERVPIVSPDPDAPLDWYLVRSRMSLTVEDRTTSDTYEVVGSFRISIEGGPIGWSIHWIKDETSPGEREGSFAGLVELYRLRTSP
jgi:hypothetical protein